MSSKDFYTPPLRFATQNIGEVACSDGGVKKYPQQRKRIKVSTLSPLYRPQSIIRGNCLGSLPLFHRTPRKATEHGREKGEYPQNKMAVQSDAFTLSLCSSQMR